MTPEEAFGVALRKVRRSRRLTQEALAEACGLNSTYISLLERGLKSPTLRTIMQICGALQMSVSALLVVVEESIRDGK